MDTELIKAIYVKSDGVYLNCKWSDSNGPYRQRKSDRLTRAYTRNGQKGLDAEIVQLLFWRFGKIQGNHPSIARFRPCMEITHKLYTEARTEINNKYIELSLNDDMLSLPDERLSDEAKTYQEFHSKTMQKLFERIANFAEPLPPSKNRDIGAR